ncbi:MAG: hypothetical protein JSU01_11435 [Bacteroidetes bacterium]|nr:hypothetical protein [Bacteroidota bacterium]
MNNEKLAANTGNRTFYFYLVQQKENEISITMYNTPYTLIKVGDNWQNAPGNYFSMAQHLIDAVIETVAN